MAKLVAFGDEAAFFLVFFDEVADVLGAGFAGALVFVVKHFNYVRWQKQGEAFVDEFSRFLQGLRDDRLVVFGRAFDDHEFVVIKGLIKKRNFGFVFAESDDGLGEMHGSMGIDARADTLGVGP